MEIRTHQLDDIPEISRLYFNTIRNINSRDYSPEQIRAWAPTIPGPSFWSERFKTRRVFVAEQDNEIRGFVEFENSGHIDCFYVHHRYQGKGIGSALFARIEEEAHTHGIRRLFAEVSLTARPFFESRGFIVKETRNTSYQEVDFQLLLMEKYVPGGTG